MAADVVVSGPSTPPEPAPGAETDLAWRVGGLVVAVVAALMSALIEVFLVPLRIGDVLIGLSVVLAIAGNLVLVWFTYRVTGWLWAVALPALVWFAVFLPAADRTAEGDLLLTGDNPVGIMTIFGGSLALAIGVARLLVHRPPALGRPLR
jgi:hypothetical protein